MNYIVQIALFMIALVLSITFTSSIALASIPDKYEYAGTISSVKVYDPVNNLHPVIQAGEQGQMEVVINEASVNPMELTFQTIPFNNCEPIGGSESKCFLSFSPAVCGGNLNYKTLQQPVAFVIDGIAPSIDSVDVDSDVEIDGKKVIGEGDLVLHYYNLRDEAECGGCAGIKELKVYKDSFTASNIVGSVQFERDSITDCDKGDGTITVPVSNLAPANTAQEKDLFVQVCDYLDQCSEDIVGMTIIVDREKPDVQSELLLANDQPATYYQSGVTYKIKATITDDSEVDFSTLSLDISQFSPTLAPTPVISGDAVTWTFTAGSTAAPSFYEISIEDKAGNLQVHRETINLQPDNAAPTINDIRTSTSYMGINYISTTSDIIIDVTDDVSGVDPSTIVLDLSDISSQYSSTENPTSCNQTGTKTICMFENMQTTKQTGTVQFSVRVSDRAGNAASPRTEQIIIDRVAPAGAVISQTLNLPTAADEGIFGFRISAVDDSPLFVSADLTEFSDSGVFNVTCPDSQNCIMTPPDLNPVWGDFIVHFIISDIAGNRVEKDYPFKLYELAQCSFQADGLVSMTVGNPIPDKLDRRLASSQTAARLFFPIKVTHAQTVKASDYTVVTCKDIQGVTLGNFQVIAQTTDTPFLVLSAAIGTGQTPANIPIECNISIQVAHNGVKCDQPEIESFSKTVELYNDALGDLGGSATDKINTITRRINKIDRDIKSKEKGIEYLGYWCSLAYGIHMVDTIIESLKLIVWGVCCILENILYTKGAAQTIWKAVCTTINMWADLALSSVFWSKYYLPTDEKSTKEILGIMSKYICMILACKFCNIDEVINVVAGAAGEISKAGADADASKMNEKAENAEATATAAPGDEAYAKYSQRVNEINTDYDAKAAGSSGEELKAINNERQARLESASGEYRGQTGRSDTYSGYDLRRTGTRDYYRYGSTVNQGRTDFYQDLGKSTTYQRILTPDEFTWDPFKSIHYAQACVCHRGIVYNWRKEKEITCAYKNCVKKHLELGLPVSSCDDMYREMECLYVESAEYKLHGFNFWENLLDAAIRVMIFFAANKAFEAICGDYYKKTEKCTSNVCGEGLMPALCGIAEAAVNLLEFADVYTKPFEQFQDRQLSEFFCANEDNVPSSAVIDDWYGVADWEQEVCQKWGGSSVEEGYAHGSFSSTGDNLQSTTVTVQAQKTVYPDESKVLYEVAWYVEPKEGQISYSIIMQSTSNTKQLAQGTAAPNSPAKSYYSEELTTEYSQAILTIPGNQIAVPIRCINCD